MNLDLEKVSEIYGESIIKDISSNVGALMNNLKYLEKLQFNNADEIFEQYPYAFLQDEDTFKEKIDNLILTLGVEYIEKLQEDMTIWSILDE